MNERSKAWTELAKKAFYTGVGALFLTEESIKSAVADLKLPKEVAAQLLQSAQKSKTELRGVLSNELQKFFDRLDLADLIKQFLREHECQISATIRFRPLK